MPDGYSVQLDKLAEFTEQVATITGNYRLLTNQLEEASLTKGSNPGMDRLLGRPEDLGPSGPPVDFTQASRNVLTDYDSLLATLHKAHAAITAQFEHMQKALTESHQVYGQLEAKHSATFDHLLDGRPGQGGDRWLHRTGATRHATRA